MIATQSVGISITAGDCSQSGQAVGEKGFLLVLVGRDGSFFSEFFLLIRESFSFFKIVQIFKKNSSTSL